MSGPALHGEPKPSFISSYHLGPDAPIEWMISSLSGFESISQLIDSLLPFWCLKLCDLRGSVICHRQTDGDINCDVTDARSRINLWIGFEGALVCHVSQCLGVIPIVVPSYVIQASTCTQIYKSGQTSRFCSSRIRYITHKQLSHHLPSLSKGAVRDAIA